MYDLVLRIDYWGKENRKLQSPDLRDETLCFESNASPEYYAICGPAIIIRRNVERVACRQGEQISLQTVCLQRP
jgi:hypothetical protein